MGDSSEGNSESGGDDTEDDEELEDDDDCNGEEEEEPEEEEESEAQTEPENEKLVSSDERKESSEGGDDGAGGGREREMEEEQEQKDGNNDDNEEEEEEDESCESPAPSLMTSGYGTFRPEELEETGDLRGEQSDGAAEDEDSRGDLSEDGGGEDGRSFCSFSGMDVEPGDQDHDQDKMSAEPEAGGEHELHQEVEAWQRSAVEEEEEKEEERNYEDTVPLSEEQQVELVEKVEDGEENEEEEEEERGEEHHLEEVDGSDESSSNPDIKFIDSKVDLSQMTFEEMCEGWEGNLRRRSRRRSGEECPVCQHSAGSHTNNNVMVVVAPRQTSRAPWRSGWPTCA